MRRAWPCVLILCGCAAAPPTLRDTPQERHSEIARLESRIDVLLRERIGIARAPDEPVAVVVAPVAPVEPPAQRVGPIFVNPSVPPTRSPLSVAPPPATVAPEPAPTVAAEPPPSRHREPRRSWRCGRIHDAAEEICDAAERICRLAGEIADGSSLRSCDRAQKDCRHSREVDSSCR